jgi:hypothetical protein
VNRSTRNIVLGLVGSALVFGCCCVSCVDVRDEPERDANGNIVRHQRHYYFRPWAWHSGGYYGSGWSHGGGYGRSFVPAPGRSDTGGGGSRPTSGATSRGGFGGTGHAVAGG